MVKRHEDNGFGIVAMIFGAIVILGSWGLSSLGKSSSLMFTVIYVILVIFVVFGLMMALIGVILDASSLVGIAGLAVQVVAAILLYYLSL